MTDSLPTTAYTTTYTITSCPVIDQQCRTGVVTTQTLSGSQAQATDDDSDGSGNSGDDEDAGGRAEVMSGMVIVFGVLAGAYNIW